MQILVSLFFFNEQWLLPVLVNISRRNENRLYYFIAREYVHDHRDEDNIIYY